MTTKQSGGHCDIGRGAVWLQWQAESTAGVVCIGSLALQHFRSSSQPVSQSVMQPHTSPVSPTHSLTPTCPLLNAQYRHLSAAPLQPPSPQPTLRSNRPTHTHTTYSHTFSCMSKWSSSNDVVNLCELLNEFLPFLLGVDLYLLNLRVRLMQCLRGSGDMVT